MYPQQLSEFTLNYMRIALNFFKDLLLNFCSLYCSPFCRLPLIQFKQGHVNPVEWNRHLDEILLDANRFTAIRPDNFRHAATRTLAQTQLQENRSKNFVYRNAHALVKNRPHPAQAQAHHATISLCGP